MVGANSGPPEEASLSWRNPFMATAEFFRRGKLSSPAPNTSGKHKETGMELFLIEMYQVVP